jgi:hypothetical protein
MPEPDPTPKPKGAGCIAGALLALGLLILVPSGLCTGALTIYPVLMFIFDPKHPRIPTDSIPMVLTIGGPFVLIGGFLTWIGYTMTKL